jgi:hypothetical protein
MRYILTLSPFRKLLLFIGLILIFGLVTAMGGLLIGKAWFDVSMMQLAQMISSPTTPDEISFLRFYQFFSQIGVFFLPVFALLFFTSNHVWSELYLDSKPGSVAIVITIILVYVALPFNGFLSSINESLQLPSSLWGIEQWMKDKEEQAARLVELILSTNSLVVLAINLVVVALMPALGEELFFRGVLLRLFRQITRNIHWAVFISAFIFSFFHLQFYGFLPRFMMGIVLGYLYVVTQNLWVPILFHFVNNASSVILFYLNENGYINMPMEEFGTTQNTVYIIGSLLMMIWLMIMLYQRLGTDRVVKKF